MAWLNGPPSQSPGADDVMTGLIVRPFCHASTIDTRMALRAPFTKATTDLMHLDEG